MSFIPVIKAEFPVFSVTRSIRNHFNMLIYCSYYWCLVTNIMAFIIISYVLLHILLGHCECIYFSS